MTGGGARAKATGRSDGGLRKRIDPDGPHLERLILLSDGVFAIAMTLLALEIKGPEHWTGDIRAMLLAVGPAAVAYLAAFGVLGVTWGTHRHMLALFERIDGVATALNILLLAIVAALPPIMRITLETALSSRFDGFMVGIRVYGVTIVVLGVAQMLLWGWAALAADLMKPAVPRPYRVWFLVRWVLAIATTVPLLVGWRVSTAGDRFDVQIQPGWLIVEAVSLAAYALAHAREKAALAGPAPNRR